MKKFLCIILSMCTFAATQSAQAPAEEIMRLDYRITDLYRQQVNLRGEIERLTAERAPQEHIQQARDRLADIERAIQDARNRLNAIPWRVR